MGCKRVLLSDTYYPALSQHHVELVTARIERMTHDGIVTADGKTDAIEVRPDVQNDFTRRLDEAHRRTVWKNTRKQDGCSSWYVHSSGRNTAIWPGFASSYWLSTLRASQRDFLPVQPHEPAVPLQTPLRRAA
jgi:cation diffusion facilitator CzcD-associated flavoprotein CzcO